MYVNSFVNSLAFSRHIYPMAKRMILAHDSFFCRKYPDADKRGFPTRRLIHDTVKGRDGQRDYGNFVGALHLNKDPMNVVNDTCPRKCRRRPEWIYC